MKTVEDAPMLQVLSRMGPVFRSLFLPSRDPKACVEFYCSHGFSATTTHIHGPSKTYLSVANAWHTIVFVPVDAPIEVLETGHVLSDTVKMIPHFLCESIRSHLGDRPNLINGFAIDSLTDPDGRRLRLGRYYGPTPIRTDGSFVCWIDAVDSFQHYLVKVDSVDSQPTVTSWSFPKQSAFLHWTSEGILSGTVQIGPMLTSDEVNDFVSCLRDEMTRLTANVDDEELLMNNVYYRILITDAEGIEIAPTLSRLEPCLKRLTPTFSAILRPT